MQSTNLSSTIPNEPPLDAQGKLRDGLWIKRIPSVYTTSQVSTWLNRIKYPGDISEEAIGIGKFKATLDNLCLLIRLQVVTFAFENTAMHYTAHHTMDISPEGLYERMVVEGKGSYCFGLNGLFLQMIRALGYRAYSGSGRINIGTPFGPPNFVGFVHMVIFVQPIENSNTTYLVDASGGGSSLTSPILLADGAKVMGSSPSEWHTLLKTARSESSLASSLESHDTPVLPGIEWHLLVTHEKGVVEGRKVETTNRVMYSFIEDEYFQADYEFANIGVYSNQSGPDDFFRENVVCARCFFLSDDEMDEIGASASASDSHPDDSDGAQEHRSLLTRYMGRLAMEGNTLKRHVGKRTETLKTMSTELERKAVLKEFFGIEISLEDLKYISGRAPALVLP